MNKNISGQRTTNLILLTLLAILLLYISSLMQAFLVPIFIAFFTALVLQSFIEKLNKLKIPNWFSIIIVLSIALSFIGACFFVLSLSFGNFVVDLSKGEILSSFQNWISSLLKTLVNINFLKKYFNEEKINQMILDIASSVLSIENFKNYIAKPIGRTFDFLTSFSLYALSLIFIIPGITRISARISRAFPDRKGEKINRIINNIKTQIQSYMVVKTIISLATGMVSFIFCLIFRVKYAFLWSFIIFLFNFIPYIGSIIAVIFPISYSVVIHQNIFHFFFFSLSLILTQIIIGNIIEPKFLSKGVNLSPIVIFTSLMIWGYVWGMVGVFIAVPLMSAINLICENIEILKPASALISASPKTVKKNKNA